MREERPSFTAACVAAARGVAGIDPRARSLVPPAFAALVRATGDGRHARVVRLVNAAALGLVDHMELRTAAIDAALDEWTRALGDRARQVVILGAGLDARAWRIDELEDAVVFELDHPATQAYKRARIQGERPRAREVRFVALDFAKDSLGEELARKGHRGDAPTFWIWEGVVMYLPREATRATLGAIAARSAPRSRLAATYGTPAGSSLGATFTRVAHVAFRAFGEPLLGLLEPSEMFDELAHAGFRVLADTTPREWSALRPLAAGRRRLFADEHLVVAEIARARAATAA
jgi:methyltransferase (TIGR00027 family)